MQTPAKKPELPYVPALLMPFTTTIKHFNHDRGYGHAYMNDEYMDLFFHISTFHTPKQYANGGIYFELSSLSDNIRKTLKGRRITALESANHPNTGQLYISKWTLPELRPDPPLHVIFQKYETEEFNPISKEVKKVIEWIPVHTGNENTIIAAKNNLEQAYPGQVFITRVFQ